VPRELSVYRALRVFRDRPALKGHRDLERRDFKAHRESKDHREFRELPELRAFRDLKD